MLEFVKRTDNVDEMVSIGRRIVEEKPEIYTDKEKRSLMVKIGRALRDVDRPTREKIFYQSVYDYWVYGTNQAEEFFYGFLHMTDEQKREYITFRNRFDYYFKMNDASASHILNDKYETYMTLRDYFKRDVIRIRDGSDYSRFTDFVHKHPEFVVKPASLGLTIGVYKESVTDCKDLKKLFEKLLEKGTEVKQKNAWGDTWSNDRDCSVVLEELIDQDDALSTIHPGSVNGVRLSTVYTVEGTVVNFYPWFKIGNQGKFITAEAFGSLMAGIDPKTGIVDTDGVDEAGKTYEYHPYTGVKIKGYVIPLWEECVAMVTELARSLHLEGIDYVGWDMALTKQGWSVVEGNFDGEFLGQLVYHKGIKRELEQLIGWKPGKEFWWE